MLPPDSSVYDMNEESPWSQSNRDELEPAPENRYLSNAVEEGQHFDSNPNHRNSGSFSISPVRVPKSEAVLSPIHETTPPQPRSPTPGSHAYQSPSFASNPNDLGQVPVLSPQHQYQQVEEEFYSPHSSPIRDGPDPQSPVLKRSFYLEKSVPVPGEGSTPEPHEVQHLADESLGLIFDDDDTRLPPTHASPSRQPALEADVIAISSPEMAENADRLQSNQIYEMLESQPDESLDSELPDELMARIDLNDAIPDILRERQVSYGSRSVYPAPVPHTLLRPPKLSRRHNHSRRASVDLMAPPDWSKSPMLTENGFEFVTTTGDGLNITSYMAPAYVSDDDDDVNSDRATIMSDDLDCFEDEQDEGREESDSESVVGKSEKRRSVNWIKNMFKAKPDNVDPLDEAGDAYDDKEASILRKQMAVIDDDLAFSRLDPETIQRHAQMFNAGGLHSSIAPRNGGPTSLIEELEIRKAGKRVQRQVFFREVAEMERQRQEDSARNEWAHPANLDSVRLQPTLLQMQHMAQADYDNRVKWHTRAINHNYIQEHASETLAQRRIRLKQERQQQLTESNPRVEETLAQRRQRLRRERGMHSSAASVYTTDTASIAGHSMSRAPLTTGL